MRNRWGQKKKNEKRENELRDVLIYGWKKKIIVGALRLYLIAFPLCFGVGLATTVLMGVDMAALAEFMREMIQDFEMRDLFYLFAELLVILSVWMMPALLVYGAVCIGERRFLRVYTEMPQEAKQALYECWIRGRSPEHLTVYEACGYILFNDRCICGTPQIVRAEDVVWGYIGRSDLQFTDMEKNYISPRLQLFSLCFYTRDGRRHRIFANVSLDEVAVWFTTHCPRAILGYGVEQKRKVEDIFKREAEQRAFLYGKEKDSYPVRKRRAAWLAVGGGFLAVMLSLAGFYGWQYINSDDYLYQKNMKKGDRWYAEGEFFEAWQAYRAAAGYREGKDEAAMKGLMLSGLELKKINSEPVYITLVYEELIDCQEMFMGEMDISVWYFECAEYYLMDERPLFAVELLERGIETFEDPETIVWEGDAEEPESVTEQGTGEEEAGRREEILLNMQSKREDILARCEVASVEEYTDGKLSRRIWYDEENREIMETNGRYLPRRWTYKTYDDAGNLVCEEICREEESGEEVKKKEKNWSYDEDGHLLHEEHYDLERGEITYEADYEYDESGNRIYLKKVSEEEYDQGVLKSECCVISDRMRIDKVYEVYWDYGVEKEEYSYKEERFDEEGRTVEEAWYDADCTPQEIQAGEAEFQTRYYRTYDSAGNCTSFSYQHGEEGMVFRVYEKEYDDRSNLIKEVRYSENEWTDTSGRMTTIWYYNDRGLPVRSETSYSGYTDSDRRGSAEIYTYDASDNLVQLDHLVEGEVCHSVIKEYDRMGNQTKEYEIDGENRTLSENRTDRGSDKKWDYEYRYRA